LTCNSTGMAKHSIPIKTTYPMRICTQISISVTKYLKQSALNDKKSMVFQRFRSMSHWSQCF
jgi:C4-dicarboxylate transporter